MLVRHKYFINSLVLISYHIIFIKITDLLTRKIGYTTSGTLHCRYIKRKIDYIIYKEFALVKICGKKFSKAFSFTIIITIITLTPHVIGTKAFSGKINLTFEACLPLKKFFT